MVCLKIIYLDLFSQLGDETCLLDKEELSEWSDLFHAPISWSYAELSFALVFQDLMGTEVLQHSVEFRVGFGTGLVLGWLGLG